MIYGMLVTLSMAIYTTVATLWQVQQILINWMMSFSLFILGLFCKPYLIVPLLAAGFFMVRRILLRRAKRTQAWKSPGNNESGSSRHYSIKTPPSLDTESSLSNSVGDTSQK
ncbi:uncharacterized protein LOC117193132 [Drosophila miranda]|uniref:uncharacterized protein LOC117193132 n=1 Tax=Drosophila miranda TaxID=7229 RepID=UPI00143F5CB3|nr:uncharacterized protein LOC117193132 [Drosophila miranda]